MSKKGRGWFNDSSLLEDNNVTLYKHRTGISIISSSGVGVKKHKRKKQRNKEKMTNEWHYLSLEGWESFSPFHTPLWRNDRMMMMIIVITNTWVVEMNCCVCMAYGMLLFMKGRKREKWFAQECLTREWDGKTEWEDSLNYTFSFHPCHILSSSFLSRLKTMLQPRMLGQFHTLHTSRLSHTPPFLSWDCCQGMRQSKQKQADIPHVVFMDVFRERRFTSISSYLHHRLLYSSLWWCCLLCLLTTPIHDSFIT